MKKTKKYYREEIAKGYSNACAVIKEAIEKYGTKRKTRGWRDTSFKKVENNWNGSIIGFTYNIYKKELLVDIYWQGDLTDGEDSTEFNSRGVTLPAESYWDGECTVEDHGDISFSSDDLYQAMKNFAAKYLK